jgi:hypothetical protein
MPTWQIGLAGCATGLAMRGHLFSLRIIALAPTGLINRALQIHQQQQGIVGQGNGMHGHALALSSNQYQSITVLAMKKPTRQKSGGFFSEPARQKPVSI